MTVTAMLDDGEELRFGDVHWFDYRNRFESDTDASQLKLMGENGLIRAFDGLQATEVWQHLELWRDHREFGMRL